MVDFAKSFAFYPVNQSLGIREAKVGKGTIIHATVVIRKRAHVEIGKNCMINYNNVFQGGKSVGRVIVGDYMQFGPNVMDGATFRYETGKPISSRHQPLWKGMSNDDMICSHLMYHITGTNTFMFKTESLRKIGGFDIVPSCQEYILMQKALDAKPIFVICQLN